MLMVSMLVPVNMRLAPWCSMCLLALSLLYLPTLHAKFQSVQEAAFMVAGSKLYIQGGKNVFTNPDGTESYTPQAQLLSLDLSEDWPTTAPKWNTTLAPGASTFLFVGVASTDNKTVITIKEDGNTTLKVNTYDITSNKWEPMISLGGLPVDIRQAIRAVVDPNTGLVYINSDMYMHVFDPRDNTIKNPTSIEGNTMPLRKFAGAAYLKSLQKIIYLGGLNGFLQYGPMNISLYSPQTEGWSALFLAWGGFNGKITTDERPVIYSLSQKQWVESYKAPAYMKSLATVTGPISIPKPSTPVSSPGSTKEDKTSSPNLGAILGGVFGGLFVLTMAGTIHLCLRRREDRAKYNAVSQKKDMTDEKDMTDKKKNSIQDQDRKLFIRNPQKLQESLFPTQAVRNPQNVSDDMEFLERVNGPQQHYSENSKCIKVIPQPVKTIYTSGISTAATTASDRPGVSPSLSVAPTVYVHGSGFYSVPVSEARNSTAAMMYFSDADIYNAQPVVPTTVANGVSVYMTPSGQYVALAGQPIQTPGAAGILRTICIIAAEIWLLGFDWTEQHISGAIVFGAQHSFDGYIHTLVIECG
ncbi:hypothetical protein BGZ82_006813 [Podila clonocystis]|nr:hypothetical protein BGZ82_006813 [Podila clonocystis]